MKRITALAAATSVAAFAALPALAGGPVIAVEEPVVAAPAPVAVAPSGDWTGFYAGGQLGYGDVDVAGDDVVPGVSGDGMTAGLMGGYRMDFGQFVAGAELNYDWADIELGDGASIDNIARLKLIGGFDMGNTLVYGTVAAVRGYASLDGEDVSDSGWGAGLGVDYALSDSMTVGAEVMEHRFDGFAGGGDVDATTLNARVGFKF